MDEIKTLIEEVQLETQSSMVDLRYIVLDHLASWEVIIDWGNYRSAIPNSAHDNPVDSLKAALSYWRTKNQ